MILHKFSIESAWWSSSYTAPIPGISSLALAPNSVINKGLGPAPEPTSVLVPSKSAREGYIRQAGVGVQSVALATSIDTTMCDPSSMVLVEHSSMYITLSVCHTLGAQYGDIDQI